VLPDGGHDAPAIDVAADGSTDEADAEIDAVIDGGFADVETD
jgi:hypothetical protein